MKFVTYNIYFTQNLSVCLCSLSHTKFKMPNSNDMLPIAIRSKVKCVFRVVVMLFYILRIELIALEEVACFPRSITIQSFRFLR